MSRGMLTRQLSLATKDQMYVWMACGKITSKDSGFVHTLEHDCYLSLTVDDMLVDITQLGVHKYALCCRVPQEISNKSVITLTIKSQTKVNQILYCQASGQLTQFV